MKPQTARHLIRFSFRSECVCPLSITPRSVLFVLFLRLTEHELPLTSAHCPQRPTARMFLPPATLENANALELTDVGTGCGASLGPSVLSFPQLLSGSSGPINHFSMTKTIHPDLWSFCCPDLYILLKVICPFKL